MFAAYSAPFLPGVLDRLKEEQDFKEFRDLHEEVQEQQRQEFVLSRVGGARAKAEHFTPTALRNLRPAHARVSLVWQLPMRAFQGYYPIPAAAATKQTTKQQAEAKQKQTKKRKTARVQTHWSRSRSYGEKRTKLAALTQIVRWLWKAHGQCGFDTCHNNIPCVAWWVILGLPQYIHTSAPETQDTSAKPSAEDIAAALEEAEKPDAAFDENQPDQKQTKKDDEHQDDEVEVDAASSSSSSSSSESAGPSDHDGEEPAQPSKPAEPSKAKPATPKSKAKPKAKPKEKSKPHKGGKADEPAPSGSKKKPVPIDTSSPTERNRFGMYLC